MKKTILVTTLLLTSGVAHSAAINYLELTGGTFSMDGGLTTSDISPGEFSNMTVGGYDGGDPVSSDMAQNSIGYIQFLTFGPMTFSTREQPWVDVYRPLTGDITNGALTLDLDAWTVWYSGSVMNQGANDTCIFADFITVFEDICSRGAAVTTYDATSGAFTASWDSVFVGGSFPDSVGTWSITGNVSAVPVPAAVWLFGSGIVGLIGAARRKKA